MTAVCWRMKRWRARCSIRQLCCSTVLVGTKRIFGSRDRFADRLRIRAVVLLPFDVRLHIGGWHQSYRMPQRLQLAGPVMGRCASLNPNQAWRQLLKEGQHETTL